MLYTFYSFTISIKNLVFFCSFADFAKQFVLVISLISVIFVLVVSVSGFDCLGRLFRSYFFPWLVSLCFRF